MDMAVYRVTKNPDFGLWQMQVLGRATCRKGPQLLLKIK